jgi:4-aminobutyrate aminotransferase-like enzyme
VATLSPVLGQATPVLVARGEGIYVYDEEDLRYLDFTAGHRRDPGLVIAILAWSLPPRSRWPD